MPQTLTGLTWRKIRAGYYESDQGHLIERRPDLGGLWFCIWPGEHVADHIADTLKEAKRAVEGSAH